MVVELASGLQIGPSHITGYADSSALRNSSGKCAVPSIHVCVARICSATFLLDLIRRQLGVRKAGFGPEDL